MEDQANRTKPQPILVFQRGGVVNIKGRGTLVVGLAPSGTTVFVGDTIEARREGIFIFRAAVRGVELPMGSPPSPPGTQRLALVIDESAATDIRDHLEVFVVARRS
jgi:hypothetical protein